MRLLALSDIIWRETKMEDLIRVVEEAHPALVLLSGDQVDDKDFSRITQKECWKRLARFLAYLEQQQVRTFFVRGNWDTSPQYEALLAHIAGYQFVEDISERVVEHGGLRVLGVPHRLTTRLTAMRDLLHRFPDPVDVVLAHAEGGRRVWLFRLPTRAILTGHFDTQLCAVAGKLFISTYNFPRQVVTLDWGEAIDVAYSLHDGTAATQHRATFIGGRLQWQSAPLPDPRDFAMHTALLLEAGRALRRDPTQKARLSEELCAAGVPKTHVREYLARSV